MGAGSEELICCSMGFAFFVNYLSLDLSKLSLRPDELGGVFVPDLFFSPSYSTTPSY